MAGGFGNVQLPPLQPSGEIEAMSKKRSSVKSDRSKTSAQPQSTLIVSGASSTTLVPSDAGLVDRIRDLKWHNPDFTKTTTTSLGSTTVTLGGGTSTLPGLDDGSMPMSLPGYQRLSYGKDLIFEGETGTAAAALGKGGTAYILKAQLTNQDAIKRNDGINLVAVKHFHSSGAHGKDPSQHSTKEKTMKPTARPEESNVNFRFEVVLLS